jgi:hypothetical protein
MAQHFDAPTPEALADLVARCEEINRYSERLTAAEESRIAALASGIVTMRQVLELPAIAPDKLPLRQARIEHWALTAPHLAEAETPGLRKALGGMQLALDAHEQIKLLQKRSWKGVWQEITLWRDGIFGLRAAELMEYLARLAALAHRRAPAAARTLLERRQALAAADALRASGPRGRAD